MTETETALGTDFSDSSLNKLAITLSGGGIRAVGFHLGTLSMLEQLDLLKNVTIISSVSGGSLPAMGYTLSQKVGRSFQDFFDDFYEFLPHMNTIEELLKRLVAPQSPSPSGRRDLITALANVYNDLYFKKFFAQYSDRDDKKLTFEMLMKRSDTETDSADHLKEIIFNATEFKTGMGFRFQVSDYRCLIGNGQVAICQKHARLIRLADIMAASSCIPGGMEPMFFPVDFHWPDDAEWDDKQVTPARPTCDAIQQSLQNNLNTREPVVALMDGGVFDNQGIVSTILAINRLEQKKLGYQSADYCGFSMQKDEPASYEDWAKWMTGAGQKEIISPELDLLIISDTPVRKASFYPKINLADVDKSTATRTNKKLSSRLSWMSKFSLQRLDILIWIIALMLLAGASLAMWDLFFDAKMGPEAQGGENGPLGLPGHIVLHILTPLTLVAFFAAVLISFSLRRDKLIANLQKIIPDWQHKPIKYVKKLRIKDLFRMGELRAGSVSALTSTIFMNRIRGLNYSTVFSRKDLENRIMPNEIFALQDRLKINSELATYLEGNEAWPPPPQLVGIINKAAEMGTKLWVDKPANDPLNDLDNLVIGGQATICYNLLSHMWKHCRIVDASGHTGNEPRFIKVADEVIFKRVLAEWQRLIKCPTEVLNERKHNSRLQELNAQVQ